MDQVNASYQAHFTTTTTADGNCEDTERTDLEDKPSFPQTKLDAFKDFDAEPRNPGHISNRNFLEILQKSHQTNDIVNEPISAANVALPESIEASSQRVSVKYQRHPITKTSEAYWDDINHLQKYMPHIKNVGRKSRSHDDVQLASFDYNGSELISNKIFKINSNGSLIVEEFAATVLGDVPTHTDTQLLVIDNLSPKLIYILRTCLPKSLEFFEEHLLNAGW